MKYDNKTLDNLSQGTKRNLTIYIQSRIDWSSKKLSNGFYRRFGIILSPQQITQIRSKLRKNGKLLTSNQFRSFGRMSFFTRT